MIAVVVVALLGSALARPQFSTFHQPSFGFPQQARTFTGQPVIISSPGFSSNPSAPRTQPAFAPGPQTFAQDVPQFRPISGPANAFVGTRPTVTVVERSEQSDDSGQFSSRFRSSDGTTVSETGSLRPTNDNQDRVVVKQGSYSFVTPEGIPVQVSYTADEYGFHPTGNVLPAATVPQQPTF